VNRAEAALVRDIFERFVPIGSATQLVGELRVSLQDKECCAA
jgi:hypothetical protein